MKLPLGSVTIAAIAALAVLMTAHSAFAQHKHRQHGAHVHGHGKLNIAIEAGKVEMELEVPGADIVGFEHAAKTEKQKAGIAEAKAKLAKPGELFQFAAQAGCQQTKAEVRLEGGDKEHSEFHANYAFTCASTAQLKVIGFPYFKTFTGAKELSVGIVSPKGQSKRKVTRTKPRVDIGRLM